MSASDKDLDRMALSTVPVASLDRRPPQNPVDRAMSERARLVAAQARAALGHARSP